MIWSFVLAALTVPGFWLTWELGNGKNWPWLGHAAFGAPWLAYALATRQWGFIFTAGMGLALNLRNFLHGRQGPAILSPSSPKEEPCP